MHGTHCTGHCTLVVWDYYGMLQQVSPFIRWPIVQILFKLPQSPPIKHLPMPARLPHRKQLIVSWLCNWITITRLNGMTEHACHWHTPLGSCQPPSAPATPVAEAARRAQGGDRTGGAPGAGAGRADSKGGGAAAAGRS